MKKIIILYLMLFLFICSPQIFSQTNTFPSSGNVGIGTTNPDKQLHIFKTVANGEGGFLHLQNLLYAGATGATTGIKMSFIDGRYLRIQAVGQDEYGNVNRLSIGLTDHIDDTYRERVSILHDGKVGIGTTNPSGKLHITYDAYSCDPIYFTDTRSGYERIWRIGHGVGAAAGFGFYDETGTNVVMFLKDGGNVGIGTTSPEAVLDVNGSAIVRGTSLTVSSTTWGMYQSDSGAKNYFAGKIGIGITDPGNYKLNVAGKIRADEVVVNTTGADFVFKPEYKLPTLSEVESFIKENNHLPDIQPAAEMKESGISVSEMQSKLLQKIEELTLYAIEQNKIIQEQNKRLKQLESTK